MLKKKLNSLTLQDVIPKPPKVIQPEPEPESESEPEPEEPEPMPMPPPPVPMRTSQPSVRVNPVAPIKVISKSSPTIRHHIVRPKVKPRM